MTAAELYRAGALGDAVAAQLQAVRDDPADSGKRIFLFELYAFAGDLDRAQRQLDAVKIDDPERQLSVLAYRQLLDSERARRKLLADGQPPRFLTESPPDQLRKRLEAVTSLRSGRAAEAATILASINEPLESVTGFLNGEPFTGFRDCDDLFAGVLEVFAKGAYFWVPLEDVRQLIISPPKQTRDLLWLPAQLQMGDDQEGGVFLPALYPRSHEHADDKIKLGRQTDWTTPDSGLTLGTGLRTFLAGDNAVSLLEWRHLAIAPKSAPAASS